MLSNIDLPTNVFLLAPAMSVLNLFLFNTLWTLPTAMINVHLMDKAHPFDKAKSKVDATYGHLHEE